MYKPVQVIEVRIWGKTVGAVALAPNLGYYALEYDSKFAKSGIELAPLTMPLAEARKPFVFCRSPRAEFQAAACDAGGCPAGRFRQCPD